VIEMNVEKSSGSECDQDSVPADHLLHLVCFALEEPPDELWAENVGRGCHEDCGSGILIVPVHHFASA